MRLSRSSLVFFVVACLCGASASDARAQSVMGTAAPQQADQAAAKSTPAQLRDDFSAATGAKVVLETPAAKTLEGSKAGGPLQVGFGRDLTDDAKASLRAQRLNWRAIATGNVASFAVTSSSAAAIRVALEVQGVPDSLELRFFDSTGHVFPPVTGAEVSKLLRQTEDSIYWSPVVEGDTVGVELYLPLGAPIEQVNLRAVRVSHLLASPRDPDAVKQLSDIGSSGGCSGDIVCQPTYDLTGRATLKLLFTSSGGFTALCTGTLMNDTDATTLVPYVLTANHCISTQASAASLNTFWYFARAVCGGPNPTSVTQLTGGALLLSTGTANDHSFLRLFNTVPGGAWYAGWTTTTPIANDGIVAIHHPAGDLKKISFGWFVSPSSYGGNDSTGDHYRVLWSNGVTEGGSSGSGLFTASTQQLVGTLHGGFSSCSAPAEPDWYGRFDQAFRFLKPWLNMDFTQLTSGSPVSSSVALGDWKFYRIASNPGSVVTFSLGGLSADADLYVRAADFPDRGLFDCRPFSSGTTAETCMVTVPSSGFVYAAVNGFAAANYTITGFGTPPPGPPTGLVAVASGTNRVTLNWAPVGNATSYTVKRGTSPGTEIAIAGGIAGTSYNDNGVTTNTTYYYVVTASNLGGSSPNSNEVSVRVSNFAVMSDFGGDRQSDVAIFRPSTGQWFIRQSDTLTVTTLIWGGGADKPVPGDYDGDHRIDVAVFRPSTGQWFVRLSSTFATITLVWGGGTDIPVQGDYDGDGITDIAIFRPTTGQWFVRPSTNFVPITLVWGGGTDIPVHGDYDGDGKIDIAVFRPSTGQWFVRPSSTFVPVTLVWGGGADKPVSGDYDGDGKTDIAIFRPSTGQWFVRPSTTFVPVTLVWGGGSDIPVPGDYDGDGQMDIAIFRPSTGEWYVRRSSNFTTLLFIWGGVGDIPILKRP